MVPRAIDLLTSARENAGRVFVYLLLGMYLFNAGLVTLITPLTHVGTPALMPQHFLITLAGFLLLILIPAGLLVRNSSSVAGQFLTAVVVGLGCSLATALSGGQIELHFTFFIAMVFLALALDIKILWVFALVVLVDHGARGYFFPDSVYGCSMWAGRGSVPLWLALEHAGFVVLQLVALSIFIHQRRLGLDSLAQTQTTLTKVEQSKVDSIIAGLNKDALAAVKELEISKIRLTFATNKVAAAAKLAIEKVAEAARLAVMKVDVAKREALLLKEEEEENGG